MALTLDAWRAAGRWFDHRGSPIFFRDEGTGPVLLCIHGYPTASWDWSALWPELTKRWRCVAPDLIGFGFSAKPPAHRYSIFDQADLIEALARSLEIREAHVLAHDYGDTVAQELLARHEDRRRSGVPGLELRSMTFLNGGLFPEEHRARPIQKLLAAPFGRFIAARITRQSFGRAFSEIFGAQTRPSDSELDDFWRLLTNNDGQRVQHKVIRYMAERRRNRARWVGAMVQTKVPLQLIDGADDPVSGRSMARRYAELIPAPRVALLEDTGHYPQVERPNRVLEHLLPFLDER